MDEIQLQLNKFLYDQAYLSARTLCHLSLYFGIHEEILFKVLAGLFVLLLIIWQHAAFLANSILLGYPLLLTIFFENEMPRQEQMLLYWPLLAFSIAFDRYLNNLPFFHVIKVAVLVGIFLYPSGVMNLRRLTRENLRLCLREWALKPEELSILERRKRHDDRRSQLITEASPTGSEHHWLNESWKSELETVYSNMTETTQGTEESVRGPRRTDERSAVSTTATSIKSTFI